MSAAISQVEVTWHVKIPLRDGVRLRATRYSRRGAGPLPAVLTITPYGADTYHERGAYFARHGYNVLLIDARGRGGSEGDFVPDFCDLADGPDAVEWVAAQPWCDGQVAMWGGSYGGMNQWTTLRAGPPHLRTIVPAAAAQWAVEYPFRGPVRFGYHLQWLALTSGVSANWGLFLAKELWAEGYYRHHIGGAPFAELGDFVGKPSRHFTEAVAHPPHDPYYESMAYSPEQYRALDVPILTIAGQYDDCQRGSLGHYRAHRRHGSPAGFAKHFVILGPWDHAGTRTPQRSFGGWTFGPAGLLDLNELHRQWYDWTLKGGPRPAFLQKQVAYYVTGAEEWRHTDDLERVADAELTLYLDSDGAAGDSFHSGRLVPESPAGSPPDQYVYDPRDHRYAELERAIVAQGPPYGPANEQSADWLTDQTAQLNLFGQGLVYHSAPLAHDLEIVGWPELTLWLQLDVPDTDFQVFLGEVLPDGSYLRLAEDLWRARYREGLAAERLVEPGAILPYSFAGLTWIGRRIGAGSRLRLVIRAPNSIYLIQNRNTGGVVEHETLAQARVAHVTLHHDAAHPSRLVLPVVTSGKEN